ncbi:hypothetical protein BGX23_001524 [Mortierella sp. AD031]|nr:hypothetical protein BGX23_001524 [Mortierella sp. AD031]
MTKKHPLLMPEVLDRVASFINLTEGDDYWDSQPSTLLPCLLVCRLWHNCFTPHLYSTFISGQSNDGSPYYPHLHHLRHFYADRALSEKELPYQTGSPPTQLRVLKVYENAEAMSDLLLANTGSRLRALTWKAAKFMVDMPSETVDGLASLSGLVSLKLDSWKISRPGLLQILAGCSSTLEMLSLRLISGYGDTPFIPQQDSTSTSWTTTASSQELLPSLPPTMERVRELRLVLDWHQSPAAVHLVQLCPALRSLYLNVDVETSDWSALVSNLRTFCPRLDSIEYEVGYSMQYETGCYIESSIYASLIRDSTVEGQLRSVTLGVQLDEAMAEALLRHAATLEEVTLGLKEFSSESMRLVGRLLAGCQRLEMVDIRDVGMTGQARDLEELTREAWVCRDLKRLSIADYQSNIPSKEDLEDEKEEVRIAAIKGGSMKARESREKAMEALRVRREQERAEAPMMFAGSGQGWYLRPNMGLMGVREASEDRGMKELLMDHMMSSGVERAVLLQLNQTKLYSTEDSWKADYDEDDEEEEEEEDDSDDEE